MKILSICIFVAMLLLSTLVLSSCTKNVITDLPLIAIETNGDLRLTLSTEKSDYLLKDFTPDNLIDFEITIEYIGDQPEIVVWRSNVYYAVTIIAPEGEFGMESEDLYPLPELQPLLIRKDSPQSYSYSSRTYSKGEYKAVAYLLVWADKERTKEIRISVELPITIK
ncbi:MAG: hypothetical protein FWE14_00240 [Lachnospiraceae bacterium]|nr:hypothetical protein [Lachnospiraceae bacterium]